MADLTDGRLSQKGTNLALRALVRTGLVLAESHPPAILYRLNRHHLAARSIEELATLRARLIEAMQDHLAGWAIPAWGAWLFGSAARGDGSDDSDIDVLVVRPDLEDDAEAAWAAQLDQLATAVTAWTGNRCRVVEYGADELTSLLETDDRLVDGLRSDGIALTGRLLPGRAALAADPR
ncbi:MAG: nucleotidyltransferase domain-containing protein [Acidimicrobiales bacterium]